MSHYSLIGASIVPLEASDPFRYFDETMPRFNASSRSGQFHSAMRSVLDVMHAPDCLRFLSAESATREDNQSDGVTMFSLLEQSQLADVETHLSNLLRRLPDCVEYLPGELLTYWGGAAAVLNALETSLRPDDNLHEDTDFDEGDSPEFFFSVLNSMSVLTRAAREGSANLLVHHWLPK